MATGRSILWLCFASLLPMGAALAQFQSVPESHASGPFYMGTIPGDDPREYEPRDIPTRVFAPPLTREQLQKQQERRQAQRRDPEQLRVLRAQRQAGIKRANPDLAQFLRIDAVTEQRLLELMTDKAMRHDDEVEEVITALNSNDTLRGQLKIDRLQQLEAEHGDQLKALLGTAGMERYYYYERSGRAREQLALFTSRLGPDDQLRQDQQQRLLELLQRLELQFPIHGGRLDRLFAEEIVGELKLQYPFMTDQERELRSQRVNINANERALRARERAAADALERIPQFLTAAQVRAYASWEAEKLNRRRGYIQQLRSAAGLPEVSQPTEDEPAAERTVPGNLTLSFRFRSKGTESKVLYLAADAGQTVSLDLSDELSVEASPTLYGDGSAFVFVRLFERGQALELPLYELGLHFEDVIAGSKRGVTSMGHGLSLHGSKEYRIELQCNAAMSKPQLEEPTL